MKTFRVTDGRQIKAARAILGMTQRELADAAGVNRNTVLRVESQGRLSPRAYAADRLARHAAESGIICETIEGRPAILIDRGEALG